MSLRLDILRVKKWFSPFACVVINKDDNSDNDGSSSNDDNDVKDYGDNYGDSYSNHHEICDDNDYNDDDNRDKIDQKMNA